MKKILLLLLLLCTLSVQAQKLETSPEGKISHRKNRVLRVFCDEKEKAVYVLRGLMIGTTLNYAIEKYNMETLQPIYTVVNRESKYWYLDMYMLNGKPTLLAKKHEGSMFTFYLVSLNDKGEEESRKKIATRDGNLAFDLFQPINEPDFPKDKLIFTENKDKPYVLVHILGNTKESKVFVNFLSPDFETISSKEIKIPHKKDNVTDVRCVINNTSGESYVITKINSDKDVDYTDFYFHKITNGGDLEVVGIKFKEGDRVSDINFFYGEDKVPYVIGVAIYKGFFVEKLDNIEKIEDPDMYLFDGKLTQHPYEGKGYCNVEKVFIQDGKYAAVFNSYYTYFLKKTYVNKQTGVVTSSKTYFIKKTSSSNITIFNNDGIESSHYTVRLANDDDKGFDVNTYIIYPYNGGYNLIARSFAANFNNGTYSLVNIKGGKTKSTIVSGGIPQYANNYNLLMGYNDACYDSAGNCYVPWQLGNTGGDVGKKPIRLLKFVP